MRAYARVALVSMAVPASFGLAGCAAIEELREAFLRWVESEKLPSVANELPEASPVVPPETTAEGAEQAAPTASPQTATADRCASSKETTDPRFHRGGEAGRHPGAILTGAEVVA
jgi:hypothetical protein